MKAVIGGFAVLTVALAVSRSWTAVVLGVVPVVLIVLYQWWEQRKPDH
ncbi:hypothetical protein OG948_54185 (plasmid) [Embleya sp. NBC_00888]|nr:hypothetical protein OG948_54185 [Embleya sp. NBC_00888]